MGKVYVFLAQGFEEIEALTVVDLGRRAGLEVETVSITTDRTVVGARKIPVVADTVFTAIDTKNADMLVLPGGGPGWQNLEKCEELMKLVDSFAKENRKISAICAAPSVLGRRGILKGKKASVYPGMEEALLGAKVSMDAVSVDGNLITSRGVGTAIDFALAIIESLLNKETATKIKNSIVY